MTQYLGWAVSNGLAPQEGPKGMPISLALGAANTPVGVKLTQEELQGNISLIQSAWIDNSLNPELLIIQLPILGQLLRIPRYWQGVVPLFSIIPFECVVSSAQANITIPTILLNMPQPIGGWAAV